MAVGRLAASAGALSGPPEFKVPTLQNRFIFPLLFTHATVLIDPGGILVTCLGATSDAGFSITLLDLLPHDTLTGLYQPSGGCEPPCGLRDSLCTLQSCCFPILQPLSQPQGSCCSRGASRDFPMG